MRTRSKNKRATKQQDVAKPTIGDIKSFKAAKPHERKRKSTTPLAESTASKNPKKVIKENAESSSHESTASKNPKKAIKQNAESYTDSLTNSLISCIRKNDPKTISSILGSRRRVFDISDAVLEAVSSGRLIFVQQLLFYTGKLDVHLWGFCIRIAAKQGYVDVLKFLLNHNKNKSDIEEALMMSDKQGSTALHICQESKAAANQMTKSILNVTGGIDISFLNAENDLGETPLMKAVQNNNLEAISLFLLAGADMSIPDKCGNTIAQVAQEHGFKDMLMSENILCEAMKNMKNVEGLGFFFMSQYHGIDDVVDDDTILTFVFSTKCEEQNHVSSVPSKPCALCTKTEQAYCQRHKYSILPFNVAEWDLVATLIKAGANFFQRGTLGCWHIPFLMAVEQGDVRMVDLMLMNLRHNLTDPLAMYATAIQIAVRNDSFKIFKKIVPLLKDNIVESSPHQSSLSHIVENAVHLGRIEYLPTLIDIIMISDCDLFKYLAVAVRDENMLLFKILQKMEKPFKRVIAGKNGTDLLKQASDGNSVIFVKLLLNLGVCVMYEDLSVCQPLMFSKSPEVTKLLLKKGACINHSYTQKDCDKKYVTETALTEAVKHNEIDIFKTLIENGARIDLEFTLFLLDVGLDHTGKDFEKLVLSSVAEANVDVSMSTSYTEDRMNYFFCSAVTHKHIKILKFLLKRGLFNQSCINDALIASLRMNDRKTFRLLLSYGADINSRSSAGEYVIEIAVYGHRHGLQTDIVPFLASMGADLNICTEESDLPIWVVSALIGRESVLKFHAFLRAGVDINLTLPSGETLLDVLLCMSAGPFTTGMIKPLVELGAKAKSNNRHFAVHKSILRKEFVLMSTLIHDAGFVPTVMDENSDFGSPTKYNSDLNMEDVRGILSPFCLAMTLGQDKIAQSMLDHLYLTVSDLKLLPTYTGQLEALPGPPTPPSLMTLSFVHVSGLLGGDGDRRQKVQQLGLPRRLQDALAFVPGTLGRIGKEYDDYVFKELSTQHSDQPVPETAHADSSDDDSTFVDNDERGAFVDLADISSISAVSDNSVVGDDSSISDE